MRHREHDAGSLTRAAAFEQGGEDLDHGSLGPRGEVGGLHGRQRGRCVGERARVAEVVEVVPCLLGARALGAEAGDRAENGGRRQGDAQPLPHSRPESLQYDVGF